MPAPLIKRVEKHTTKNVGIRLPVNLDHKLTQYAAYLNVKRADIVAKAVEHVINIDAEFLKTISQQDVSQAVAVIKAKTSASSS
jgi:hypothetical protein